MRRLIRTLARAVTAIVVGTCVVFFGLAGAVTLAFVAGVDIGIPGLVRAGATWKNGARAVDVEPSAAGIGVAILLAAVAYTALHCFVARRDADEMNS